MKMNTFLENMCARFALPKTGLETSNTGDGFHVTFPNGNTVSVQWHGGSYCWDRNNNMTVEEYLALPATDGVHTVEVAAWREDGSWYHLSPCDDVAGWQPVSSVLLILEQAEAGTLESLPKADY